MDNSKYLAAVKNIIIAFWLIVIFYTVLASIPESPVSLSYKDRNILFAILPEGWAFFTRDPREPRHYVYKKKGTEWVVRNLKNANIYNFFGIKREARVQAIEIAVLLQSIPENKWTICDSDINEFLKENEIQAVSIENKTVKKTLCGEVLIQERNPIPWAWSKFYDCITMPAKIALLNIKCN